MTAERLTCGLPVVFLTIASLLGCDAPVGTYQEHKITGKRYRVALNDSCSVVSRLARAHYTRQKQVGDSIADLYNKQGTFVISRGPAMPVPPRLEGFCVFLVEGEEESPLRDVQDPTVLRWGANSYLIENHEDAVVNYDQVR